MQIDITSDQKSLDLFMFFMHFFMLRTVFVIIF